MKTSFVLILITLLVSADAFTTYGPHTTTAPIFAFDADGPTTMPHYVSAWVPTEVSYLAGLFDIPEEYIQYDYKKSMPRVAHDIYDIIVERLIPEFCDVTPDTCTMANTYLLDCNCVRKFSKLRRECRNTLCDVMKKAGSNIGAIVGRILYSTTLESLLKNIHDVINELIGEGICECAQELSTAVFNCAEFYDGNVLTELRCEHRFYIQRALRNVDLTALTKFMNKLLEHLCGAGKSGKCFDDIFVMFENLGYMMDSTIGRLEEYEEADVEEAEMMEKACDDFIRFINPLQDLDDEHGHPFSFEYDDIHTHSFHDAADIMNALYCHEGCKAEISETLYPCCLSA